MSFRSQPLKDFAHFPASRRLLAGLLLLMAAALAAQLVNLSVRRSEELSQAADRNLVAARRLASPRGNIIASGGEVLATNRRQFRLTFSPASLREADAEAAFEAAKPFLGQEAAARGELLLLERTPGRHTLAADLGIDGALPFLEQPARFHGFRVEEEFERVYPLGADFSLLLGHVGKIAGGEQDRFAAPRYLASDEVGRNGLERALEDRLAGRPGKEVLTRDARGRALAAPAMAEEAAAGDNVYLTLDAALQRRATELLGANHGSVVLMDAQSGAIVVMASSPSFDPDDPAAKLPTGADPGFLNLAVRGLYPPGSTFKVVAAAVALKHGMDPREKIPCPGFAKLPGWDRPFWCSVRSGHGQADMAQSLQWSCNCYYYELSRRLPAAEVAAMAREFGFATKTGVDLPGEKAGELPTEEQLTAGEAMNLAIGQGRVLATPLQVAVCYAALGNGGRLLEPFAIRGIGSAPPEADPEPKVRARLPLTPAELAIINDGLDRVVNAKGGTANKAGFRPGWEVVGKTGTAENPRGGVDAWFAGYFPRGTPRYAIAVHVVDASGHGGDIAAPIAKDLVGAVLGETPEVADAAE